MKKNVKVVGVQFDVKSAVYDGVEGRDWNVNYMVDKIEEYGKDNDLIVFPELANCGYVTGLDHETEFRKHLYKNGAEDFPNGYTELLDFYHFFWKNTTLYQLHHRAAIFSNRVIFFLW